MSNFIITFCIKYLVVERLKWKCRKKCWVVCGVGKRKKNESQSGTREKKQQHKICKQRKGMPGSAERSGAERKRKREREMEANQSFKEYLFQSHDRKRK